MRNRPAALLLLALAALPWMAFAAPGEDFSPCEDARSSRQVAGSLCARFPLPGGKSLSLRQFPSAGPSRGQVWLIAGESGAALYPLIETLRKAFPGYDLIVPDRRASADAAAHDLQAEIERYSKGGDTLLYSAPQGSEVVLKAIPLVRARKVEAVILDSPPTLSVTIPGAVAIPSEQGLDIPPPKTLVLQGGTDAPPPAEPEKGAPVTTYTIEGAPGFLMLTVPECAAPLVHGFLEGSDGGAPCAGRLTIRF